MMRNLIASLGAALIAIVFLCLCASPANAQLTGPAVRLSVNLSATDVSVNDILTVSVIAYDAGGNSVIMTPYVTISSDSPDIVLPYSNATLGCAGGVGTATVTASLADLTGSAQVRVNNTIKSFAPLQIISLFPKATNLATGQQPFFAVAEKRQMLVFCTDGAKAEVAGLCTFRMADATIAKVQASYSPGQPSPGEVEGLKVGETTLTATAGSLTGTTLIKIASRVIISPVAVLSNTGGQYDSDFSVNNIINRTGLSPAFNSGVTEFDAYLAQNPRHNLIADYFEWWAPYGVTGSTIILDLGQSYNLGRFALWNEESDGIHFMKVDASDNPTFATYTMAGSFYPKDNPVGSNYLAEVFNLTATLARYVRLTITGPGINPVLDQVAMGEIAFSVGPPDPDPYTPPTLPPPPLPPPPPPPFTPVRINSGTGGTVSPYSADAYASGGSITSNSGQAVDITGVTNPAPIAVYQTERYGQFTYTIPGMTKRFPYTVRLHFCESYFGPGRQGMGGTGSRKFNVGINGVNVLSQFDIFASAGGAGKAIVRSFTATANANGQIVIAFTRGSIELPTVSGVEITP